jgi:hypothetical protein
MERWGALSVKDHIDRRALATEVLLYDKRVIPAPPDWDVPGGRQTAPDLVRAVKTLMRELIDGTIPLADRTRTPLAWKQIKDRTQEVISGLSAAIDRSRL